MEQIKCDGCGMTENTKIPGNNRRIEPVQLTFSPDSRYWVKDEKIEADLCETCIGTLSHTYFGHPAEGLLEVPAFLEPTSLERRRVS